MDGVVQYVRGYRRSRLEQVTTKARGRTGRPKDQEKGSAILDAGWALFLERGVGAVSIEAIAARAGVSKMTVYGHFTDKHVLFEAAVAREMRGIEAAQQLDTEAGPGRPIEERLRAFGIGLLTFLYSQPAVDFYNILSGELRRHPDVARRFYDAGPGQTLANLAALLASAPDQVAIGDPVEAAEALFGLWQGASNYQVSLGVETADHAEAIAKRVERAIELFMRAYGRASP